MQIRTIRIGYEPLKRKFEPFERELKYDIQIWTLQTRFEAFEGCF